MELRLVALLLMFRGDWYILQGPRQSSLEPLTRGSELSLRFKILDPVFVEEELICFVEVKDCLEN